MKKTLLFSFFLSCSLLPAADPPELNNLRNNYHMAVERATLPLAEVYLKELGKMKEGYLKSGNTEAAEGVEKEMQSVAKKLVQSGKSLSGRAVKILESKVTIAANSTEGFPLGSLKKGDVITLSYESGNWKNNGNFPTDNPDAGHTERGDLTRLALVTGVSKGQLGEVVLLVPASTKETPFVYPLPRDYESLNLRIAYGGDNPKAPGSVTYSINIVR